MKATTMRAYVIIPLCFLLGIGVSFLFRRSVVASETLISSTVLNTWNDEMMSLALIHTTIAEGNYRDYDTDSLAGQTAFLSDEIDDLLVVDVVAEIEWAEDKPQYIQQFLAKSDQTIAQSYTVEQDIIQHRQLSYQTMQQCAQDKTQADQEFYLAMQQDKANTALIDQLIQNSASAGGCQQEASINYNAYGILLENLDAKQERLQTKMQIVQYNQDLLLENTTLLESQNQTLQELLRLQDSLGQYTQ